MRKSLISLVSALLLSTAVFGPTEVRAQAGIGSSESGTWYIGPRTGAHQTVIRPSGRQDLLIYSPQMQPYGQGYVYGQPGPADYYNYYDYQIRGGYQAGHALGRGLRALFGDD